MINSANLRLIGVFISSMLKYLNIHRVICQRVTTKGVTLIAIEPIASSSYYNCNTIGLVVGRFRHRNWKAASVQA